MLGRKSGFGALVKADAPHIIVTHCILHRHALATKTLSPTLAEVLKIVVECVNYVRNSALRHRIFSELCKEMGSEFEFILILAYMAGELKQAIATHLDELVKSLDGYFPTRESYPAWVRQPFTFSVETTDVNDEYLEEIIEIQQSQVRQQLFKTTTLSTFWCQQMVTYPVIAKKALEIFIPFVTTYLCEQSFSRMLDIKTKKRNRLCCEKDMRVALAKVKPCISELVSERQQQKSH
ncbi:protein ZBED8 [Tachysurus ichikawai]